MGMTTEDMEEALERISNKKSKQNKRITDLDPIKVDANQ
jgi:hypothetical protein